MFTIAQFETLYKLLGIDMVAGDCGIKCQQYCCRGAGALKYFLPGEEEAFNPLPSNLEIVDHFLCAGYRSRVSDTCACTREQRPFCCRIFPFRPKLDLINHRVIGLNKAVGAGFDQHCWISEPLPQWHEAAINAWQIVLDDQDNLLFYARYAKFLINAYQDASRSSSSILYDIGEELLSADEETKWQSMANFFIILGREPETWKDLINIENN